MQSRWRFQRNIILVERHPPRLLHYFASPGELAPSFYVTTCVVTLLILTLCFRMIHLQTACCGGNSATQEPHAAHTSHRNTMPDLAPRPRRASTQPQRMGTQVSGGKDVSKIRMTTAAQEYLMGWHKNPTEAKRAHNLERCNHKTFAAEVESWRGFVTPQPRPGSPAAATNAAGANHVAVQGVLAQPQDRRRVEKEGPRLLRLLYNGQAVLGQRL